LEVELRSISFNVYYLTFQMIRDKMRYIGVSRKTARVKSQLFVSINSRDKVKENYIRFMSNFRDVVFQTLRVFTY
jgi:hypothetical protein